MPFVLRSFEHRTDPIGERVVRRPHERWSKDEAIGVRAHLSSPQRFVSSAWTKEVVLLDTFIRRKTNCFFASS